MLRFHSHFHPRSLTSLRPNNTRLVRAQIRTLMSSSKHPFVLYAPDYTDEGALQRRLKVRGQHFADARELRSKGVYGIAGGLLSLDGVGAVDPAQKLIGSMIIIYAESLDEARKIAESDVYWTGNVWDKERTTLAPFLSANLNSD